MDFLEVTSRKRKRRVSDNRTKLPSNIQNVIEKLFEKKFSYEKREDYMLTSNFDGKHLSGEWQIKEYMSLKNELNMLKNELNDKDMITWHEHTRLVNLAGNIAPEVRNRLRPELCTQAWCKFYEIASTYLSLEDRKSLVTVHLCEAPGAFITSLNHFLITHSYAGDWQWLATTLNPYYEGNNIGQMIDEDKFIRCSYGNWYFGEDGTGNLMSKDNLRGLQEKLVNVKVDVVTADGSIDCQGDPAEQENVVSRLQHCEVLTALHILSPGGTLVVKMFTLFECKAVGLMYLLNCVFEKVEVFKPCTSKGGNSEVYVIGLKFKGRECCEDFLQNITSFYFGPDEPDGCLFSQDDIPGTFLEQHTECVTFFKDCQMSTIQRNLDLLNVMADDEKSKVEEQKDFCMECFFNRYDVKPLPSSARIMKYLKGRKGGSNRTTEFAAKVKLEGKFTGSFCERQELSTLPWQQKINKIETYEDEVNREDNSLWIKCQEEILEHEIELLQEVRGKPIDSIQSSRFCHGFYLGQVHEIIKNSRWLTTQTQSNAEFVTYVACKLKELLLDTIQYYNGGTIPDHTSTSPMQHLKVNENVDQNQKESCTKLDNIEQDTEMSEVPKQRAVSDDQKGLDREHHCNCSLKGCKDSDLSVIQSGHGETCACRSENSGSSKHSSKWVDKAGDTSGETGDNCDETGDNCDETGETCDNCDETGETGDNCDETGDNCDETGDNEHTGENDPSRTCRTSSIDLQGDSLNKMDIGEDAPSNGEDTGSLLVGECIPKFTCVCINSGSPILDELSQSQQSCSDGQSVRLYTVSVGNVCDKFELVEQGKLLSVVQDILKNCETSDYVVVEMGTCLSRFTAGLVYLLYRSFREIGFVHHHGNLMKRHLVCVDFQNCPIRLCQYLEEVGHMTETDQSNSVLEIVPVLTMLEDDEFTSFLRISNVNLLQSFITTVVNQEKQIHCQGDNT
ncbi:cap-specific mRNA (nucleoside-2'-O-)-methyltransferase 2-like [Mercenaria mercenaria]|uniref:cap-specific mRNA (nucleoside-2'-O-)-methyltransferase 2-like n=1 Tax=Mercenaria mercenaria TaxID=6596 RepID=UPI00234E5D3D|nr:cap-specific mRNA (nucleoside-2'-O-)-methyltransferase 2-like [Mercenaria mercenaria]XP_045199082.2 cap-specific mRNA (nucleoside-2'-O-)-methyltransferase 2-like [Mercenaria mercenaria]